MYREKKQRIIFLTRAIGGSVGTQSKRSFFDKAKIVPILARSEQPYKLNTEKFKINNTSILPLYSR